MDIVRITIQINANASLILRFKDKSGGVLFMVNIEIEPYKSNVYHGLTVRCGYSNEPKDSSNEVGVVPYNEVEKVTMSRTSVRPI